MSKSIKNIYYVCYYDSRLGGKVYAQWTEGWIYAVEYDNEELDFFKVTEHTMRGWECDSGVGVFHRHHNPMPPREKWRIIYPQDMPRISRRLISKYSGIDIRTEEDKVLEQREAEERAAAAKAAAEAAAEARRIDEAKKAEERKAYGKLCGAAARKVDLPFDIILTVGPELAQELKDAMLNLNTADELDLHELLCCGIARRKSAIFRLLPEISDELYDKIEYMGQIHSNRLADFIADHCPKYS